MAKLEGGAAACMTDCVKSKRALIKGIVNAVKSLFHPNGSSIVLGVKIIIDTHRYFEFRFLTFGFRLAILLHVL